MNIDFNKCQFMVDEIQEYNLKQNLRDKEFLRVFRTDFTGQFLEQLRKKVKDLREPMSINIVGQTRSGKSVSAIYICGKIAGYLGFELDIDNICANEYEFVNKVATWIQCYKCNKIFGRPEVEEDESIECPRCKAIEIAERTTISFMIANYGKLDFNTLKIGIIRNNVFLIDESKKAVYGVGSMSRITKLLDIQNIIAVNNISTVWLRPDNWSSDTAPYGLKTFGKSPYHCTQCHYNFPRELGTLNKPKLCPKCASTDIAPRLNRFLFYDLSSGGGRFIKPFSMVYLPHFADVLPNGPELEQNYLAKKLMWVEKEQTGEGDVTYKLKQEKAEKYTQDPNFMNLKLKDAIVYVASKEGSEMTKNEVEEIVRLARLMIKGQIN